MILVVGASGLVGSLVVDRLLEDQKHEIRALARGKSDWGNSVLPRYRRSGIDVVIGDVRDRNTAMKITEGCSAVINCSGLMRERVDETLSDVNWHGVRLLTDSAARSGVQRFIHLSCLGATEHSSSTYFQSKWLGEDAVRNSPFYWTIFRPSLIFGEGSQLSRMLDFWVGRLPFTVVIGSGLNRFQPVSAQIVAECIVQSIYNRDCVGQSYDLVGPETVDLNSMLQMVAEAYGKSGHSIKIPSVIGIKIAALLGRMNRHSPIDDEVIRVLTSELVGDSRPMLDAFDIKAIPFRASLPAID